MEGFPEELAADLGPGEGRRKVQLSLFAEVVAGETEQWFVSLPLVRRAAFNKAKCLNLCELQLILGDQLRLTMARPVEAQK